jgi:general secretion pathway protein A
MVLDYYGLTEPPFSITPDPRFVFLSERHRDALAHLLFGIGQGGSGGFVQLTGEVGTGKTTLCRLLLEQLPENTRVALVLNPRQTPVELLETVCEELHLDIAGRRGSAKALVDALNVYLLDAYAQGLRVVLIIDEAQDLSTDALEQVRLLTNLETPTQKLLQVVLLGQPELRTLLARDDLRQLAQRITARYHLTPLDADETAQYLRHRYNVAGGRRLPFSRSAIRHLHRHAGGVPRLINIIAERSLLAGYARDQATLDARTVDLAARETLPPHMVARTRRPLLATAAALVVVLASAGAWAWWRNPAPRPVATTHPAPVAAARHDAPPAKPVAASKPTVAMLDGDALTARLATTRSALPALLSAWQLPHADADLAVADACAPELAPGVSCLRGHASLDSLVAIGRPVLLHLRDGDHATWALLLGSDARRVRLQFGDSVVDVPRVALPALWHGEYWAIWRAGDATPPPDVRRFQAAHGLPVDGVLGPETRYALASDGPGPRLTQGLD